ncbi:MAG: class 1 fructose-bisphosphatase [bacterium]
MSNSIRRNLTTVESHILAQQRLHPSASGDFTSLLSDITFAAKIISREVKKAGLVDILGSTGDENIQGEVVQKLDEYADRIFIRCLGTRSQVCALASEENEEPIFLEPSEGSGRYIVVFDPLDGSSNIDANVSVGTIFSIYARTSPLKQVGLQDVLQPGKRLLAAGYIIYGSSTMFVYTTGHGVHGFTLDPGIGEFLLSHKNIRTPFTAGLYSLNEAYEPRWSDAVRKTVAELKLGREGQSHKNLTSRYIGSLVADFHRNLLYGGVFLYPPTSDRPQGKLRLMYEAAPLAWIIENAGGYASDGHGPILEVVPKELHQRIPLYIGCRDTVLWIEKKLTGAVGDTGL